MSTHELFIEIRTEELPPSMVQPALDGLRDGALKLLEGVAFGALRCFATPRRLAVAIADVAEARPRTEKIVTGPPVERAYADGQPTATAIGFAKGKGIEVEALQIVDTPKGKMIAAVVVEGGERTVARIAEGLDALVRGLPFHKSMEWSRGGLRFGRPITGISALFGGSVIEGTVAGFAVTATSVGHRFAPSTAFTFTSADEWLASLRQRWVEPDLAARRARIDEILAEVSAELGADPIVDRELADQVVHLVEWPTKMIATFEADLLHLPPRLLIESMKVHQRCFPIHIGGKLTNRFVVVSNNPGGDPEIVAAGFARVLRARFHDAKFFFAEDKKQRLDAFGESLVRMRWIKGLGTMAQKQARVAALGAALAPQVHADPTSTARAGALCKADLLTQMVGEFPELQGHMGRLYAAAQGETEAVSLAIEEHYLPRFAEDAIAATPAGVALALADRLDTLVGCFGVGMEPKGGGDPQGLRRAALGLVNTLAERQLGLDLRELFATAVQSFHSSVCSAPDGYQAWVKEQGTGATPKDADGLVQALVEFGLARLKAQAVSEGTSADLIDAVLIGGESRPLVLLRKIAAIRTIARSADFLPIMHTFKRVLNISRDADTSGAGALTEPAEIVLDRAFGAASGRVDVAVAAGDYVEALEAMLALREPVAQFFDAVLVDAPDPAVRAARMGLLRRISATFLQVADFSRISTR